MLNLSRSMPHRLCKTTKNGEFHERYGTTPLFPHGEYSSRTMKKSIRRQSTKLLRTATISSTFSALRNVFKDFEAHVDTFGKDCFLLSEEIQRDWTPWFSLIVFYHDWMETYMLHTLPYSFLSFHDTGAIWFQIWIFRASFQKQYNLPSYLETLVKTW